MCRPRHWQTLWQWIDRLDASGSTDINRALLEALAQLGGDETGRQRVGYVLFMTDGLPTQGETDVAKILRNAAANRPADTDIRLFTFGVGFDVNTDLLDTVSRQMGGRSRYVRPDEQIDEAVSQFYSTIQTPVLTNVQIDFGDGPSRQRHVSVSASGPLCWRAVGGDGPVSQRGRRDHCAVRKSERGEDDVHLSGAHSSAAGGEPFVARLWATRKIGALMEEIRRNGPNPEIVDAIVDLSMRYGIVTPYTSYLVEEPVGMDRSAPASTQAWPSVEAPAEERLSSARASVAAEAGAMAAAPASGEAAVADSEEREKLQTANAVDEHRDVKFAGGKTFVSHGTVVTSDGREETVWVDTQYQSGMRIESVGFASDRYFELASDEQYADILALSTEILFAIDDDVAVRVSALDETIDTETVPSPAVDAQDQAETLLEQFLRWLAGNSGR